jgi:hypothetical protein
MRSSRGSVCKYLKYYPLTFLKFYQPNKKMNFKLQEIMNLTGCMSETELISCPLWCLPYPALLIKIHKQSICLLFTYLCGNTLII